MVIVLLGGKLAGRCGVPIRVDDAVCKVRSEDESEQLVN